MLGIKIILLFIFLFYEVILNIIIFFKRINTIINKIKMDNILIYLLSNYYIKMNINIIIIFSFYFI